MEAEFEALLEVNRAFYRAFAESDMTAMTVLWSRQTRVACVHPGWDALYEYDTVMQSWRDILSNPASPGVSCRNEMPYVYGDFGFVICHEVLEQGVLVATNAFALEDGAWKMVFHQASPLMATNDGGFEPDGDVEAPQRLH